MEDTSIEFLRLSRELILLDSSKERAVTSPWGIPADCEQPKAIAWHKRRQPSLGEKQCLGQLQGTKHGGPGTEGLNRNLWFGAST
jgi:hypothetical protein